MRIDQKYYNRFIGICAAITAVIIIYSTIRYFQRQVTDFENNVSTLRADTLSFRSLSSQDSLFVSRLPDQPAMIHFWSEWSDKSMEVGEFLRSYVKNQDELIVIAASVDELEEIAQSSIEDFPESFYVVHGSDLYETIRVPGMPTQIFINRRKQIFDTHVGNDTTEIRNRLDQLLNSE